MILHVTPYSIEKNLAKAYNETMQLLKSGDSAVLRDIDTLYPLPETAGMIEEYAICYPGSVLTCFCNRVSHLSHRQLLGGIVNENPNIITHISLARSLAGKPMTVTQIERDISGFLMVVPQEVWAKYPFDESGKCLGVDTYWNRAIRAAGVKILRMDSVYIWHTYRLEKGITNKTHLV